MTNLFFDRIIDNKVCWTLSITSLIFYVGLTLTLMAAIVCSFLANYKFSKGKKWSDLKINIYCRFLLWPRWSDFYEIKYFNKELIFMIHFNYCDIDANRKIVKRIGEMSNQNSDIQRLLGEKEQLKKEEEVLRSMIDKVKKQLNAVQVRDGTGFSWMKTKLTEIYLCMCFYL